MLWNIFIGIKNLENDDKEGDNDDEVIGCSEKGVGIVLFIDEWESDL